MLSTANPTVAVMEPPAAPAGWLPRLVGFLDCCRQAFSEAQEMRREAHRRHAFIDS